VDVTREKNYLSYCLLCFLVKWVTSVQYKWIATHIEHSLLLCFSIIFQMGTKYWPCLMKHLLPCLSRLFGEQVLPLSFNYFPLSVRGRIGTDWEQNYLWVKGGFEVLRAWLPKPMLLLVWTCYSEFGSCCATEHDSDQSSTLLSKRREDAVWSVTMVDQAKLTCQNVFP